MTKHDTLNPKHPELTALTQGARKYARYVAFFAAERAIDSARVSDPPVPYILEAIRESRIREWVRQRGALADLAERLDGEYWEASDAQPHDAARMMMAFRRARAVNSLVAAIAPNEVQAALDAVYEAYHALPEDEADSFVDEAKEKLRYYGGLP